MGKRFPVFGRVKIRCVPMRGLNMSDMIDLVPWKRHPRTIGRDSKLNFQHYVDGLLYLVSIGASVFVVYMILRR